GEVDAVITWRYVRRATDAHMHLFCSAFTQKAHSFAAGIAAHDGIINQHDTLAFHRFLHRIHLHAPRRTPVLGIRTDKGAANVMITHDAHIKGDTAFFGKTKRRIGAAIRHRDHHIRLHWRFFRQLGTEAAAYRVHPFAEDQTVRPGE